MLHRFRANFELRPTRCWMRKKALPQQPQQKSTFSYCCSRSICWVDTVLNHHLFLWLEFLFVVVVDRSFFCQGFGIPTVSQCSVDYWQGNDNALALTPWFYSIQMHRRRASRKCHRLCWSTTRMTMTTTETAATAHWREGTWCCAVASSWAKR